MVTAIWICKNILFLLYYGDSEAFRAAGVIVRGAEVKGGILRTHPKNIRNIHLIWEKNSTLGRALMNECKLDLYSPSFFGVRIRNPYTIQGGGGVWIRPTSHFHCIRPTYGAWPNVDTEVALGICTMPRYQVIN